MSRLTQYQDDTDVRIITGACPHDCPDTCTWQVAVHKESGRAIDIWGHAEHPVTQGTLCGKVDRYLERTYHSGRLTTPLRRVGPKGSGQFEPLSWEQALREIAEKLHGIIRKHGAEAVLPYSYSGTLGYLQGEGMATRFFNRMGASQLARTICSEAGFEGYLYTIGASVGMDTPDYAQAKLILIWGSNTLTSNLHLWPLIQQARKSGAKVIVIDPARTRTARAADEWIGINPGTDAALALAMMNVIISENLHDPNYISQHTVGFDQLKTRVGEWSVDRAAEITGIGAERIRSLAIEYATMRPAAIRVNYGMQRHYGGGMAMRTVACLPALIGAWKELGGGIQLSLSGGFRHIDTKSLDRPDLLAGRFPRTINMNRLGDALSTDLTDVARSYYNPRPVDAIPAPDNAGPLVKALLVYNSNPAAVCPEQAKVLDGLRRDDLFTVVMENFQTDTADYADYLLPATTQLEHWDIHRSYGHLFLSLNQPAIEPLAESLPNSEIFRRLATAMGYADDCFQQSDEEILRLLIGAQTHASFDGITWERLLQDGYARLNYPDPYLPFAEGNFFTPSGKCEFYSERMAQDGYDPLPSYTPPLVESKGWGQGTIESPVDQASLSASQSLACISPPAHSFLNSSFVNVDRFQTREIEPLLWIHPVDATDRDVVDGASVQVENELGSVTLRAKVTDDVVPGTVLAPGIWWNKFTGDGRNINQIVPQEEADMGAGALFYDARVWVEPLNGKV